LPVVLHLIRRAWVGLALEKLTNHRLAAALGGSDEASAPVLPERSMLTGVGKGERSMLTGVGCRYRMVGLESQTLLGKCLGGQASHAQARCWLQSLVEIMMR
jgi:hypothetical protein